MAYDKNRHDRLRITLGKVEEGETISEQEGPQKLSIRPDVEELISPRDALESLCIQRNLNFGEFETLFNWFVKENNLYAISKNAMLDADDLKQLSHEDILAYLKGRFALNYQCYYELGTNFHFFNSIAPYRAKPSRKKVQVETDSIADTIYEVAFTKMDQN